MITGLSLLVLPVTLQGVLMIIDEFVFHRRRGLGWWERLGHPLDTLSVLVCLGIAAFAPLTLLSFQLFFVAALVSCVLVTKDEWVHTRECHWFENWIHALLFIVHPLVLGAAFLQWVCRSDVDLVGMSASGTGDSSSAQAGLVNTISGIWGLMKMSPWMARVVLYGQCLTVGLFLVYQIKSIGRGPKPKPRVPATEAEPQTDLIMADVSMAGQGKTEPQAAEALPGTSGL